MVAIEKAGCRRKQESLKGFQRVQGRKQWFWSSKSQETNINSFGGYPKFFCYAYRSAKRQEKAINET